MIIDFKFVSLVISLFCHLSLPPFIFRRTAARSPDLIPLDFFLRGVLKNQVFSDKPKTLYDLKEHIINALKDITPKMYKKVTASIIKQCHHRIGNNGLHFEHLLQCCVIKFVLFNCNFL